MLRPISRITARLANAPFTLPLSFTLPSRFHRGGPSPAPSHTPTPAVPLDLRPDSREAARLREAMEMHDLGIRIYRQRMRRENPRATNREIDELVTKWLLAR